MLEKEELYTELAKKLETVKESQFLEEPFSKGFKLGEMYEWIGVFYRFGIINTEEYIELTDFVSDIFDKIVESKEEGVDYEIPSIK